MCKTTINTGLQREGENGMRGCLMASADTCQVVNTFQRQLKTFLYMRRSLYDSVDFPSSGFAMLLL